jgi:hypothetical protein
MDRTTYQQKADVFLTEIMLEEYNVGAGLKEMLELTPIYERHADLFGKEAVQARLDERDTAIGRYLADFAITTYLYDQVKDLSEEIANTELATTVPWDGLDVAYRNVPILLMNEDDRHRRLVLAQIYHSKQTELNPLRIHRWNRLHDLARNLGFKDYVTLHDELRGLDLQNLSGQMTWLLDVTGDRFEAQLGTRLAERGIPRDRAGIWDVSATLRAKEFDPLFPRDRMLPALKQTLSGLGIDLDAQENLYLDTDFRPLKSPRAFCVDVRPPADVRLVIKPAGGVDDYMSLFHEAGHAEHFAHVASDLELAYRRLGDNSVTETYAFLLEHLLFNPAWLAGVMGLKPVEYEPARDSFLFGLLWFVRRYAAKLNYEMELQAGLVQGKANAYVYWLKRGCQVQIPPERYLEDVDDGFYVAQYLRAWIFEAQLRRHLEQNFGAEWFARRATGDFLKDLWHIGQQYTVDDLARQIGAEGLDIRPLVHELSRL